MNKNYMFLCYIITLYTRYENKIDEYATFIDYMLDNYSYADDIKYFIKENFKTYLISKFVNEYHNFVEHF